MPVANPINQAYIVQFTKLLTLSKPEIIKILRQHNIKFNPQNDLTLNNNLKDWSYRL